MKTLWNKFLNASPWVRMLVAVVFVLLLSLVTAGIGLYNFVRVLKGEIDLKPTVSDSVMTNIGFSNPLPATTRFFSAMQTINSLADQTSLGKPKAQPGSLTPELTSAFHEAVAVMAAPDMTDILDQGYRSFAQLDEYNLRLLRDRVRCLASLSIQLKREVPTTDLSPLLKAMVNDTVLMERVSPLMISKMVSIACGGIMTSMLHQLVVTGSVSPTEARSLRSVFNTFVQYRLSLAEALRFETRFVENAMLKLYTRAPLGSWLLQSIFGDPLVEYRSIMTGMNTMDTEALRKAIEGISHPLAKIMFPNMIRVREVHLLKSAFEEIVLQELTDLEGDATEKQVDPYTSKSLLVKHFEGINQYYAAGPNGRDDGMSDDDVFFPLQ